jgi:phenylacetate-coenzyme A ligase PaaK-like adenylate-forming protein
MSNIPRSDYLEYWLNADLDAWTRYVLRRHFDPELGSPFWVKQAASFSFDPLDITRYSELEAFGPFDLQVLREIDPADLVPRHVPRPIAGHVWETGGTTSHPCRVLYTPTMHEHRAQWRLWSYRNDGFTAGATWLHATASGPHIAGHGAAELAETFAGRMYGIDMDPRWVKTLLRAGRLGEAEEYTAHVVEAMAHILRGNQIDYMYTTTALMRALTRRHPELAGTLRAVRLTSTHISPVMYRELVAAVPGCKVTSIYGNTFGSCIGLPVEDNGDVMPYVPSYPHVTVAVTDRADWRTTVGYGETGRVRLTALYEDLFLPNILERDQAIRYRTSGEWPVDGVANVRPLQETSAAPEGIY